jgi:hypothetical protein
MPRCWEQFRTPRRSAHRVPHRPKPARCSTDANTLDAIIFRKSLEPIHLDGLLPCVRSEVRTCSLPKLARGLPCDVLRISMIAGQGLAELLQRPVCGRMRRNIVVHDPTCSHLHHDEYVENANVTVTTTKNSQTTIAFA